MKLEQNSIKASAGQINCESLQGQLAGGRRAAQESGGQASEAEELANGRVDKTATKKTKVVQTNEPAENNVSTLHQRVSEMQFSKTIKIYPADTLSLLVLQPGVRDTESTVCSPQCAHNRPGIVYMPRKRRFDLISNA